MDSDGHRPTCYEERQCNYEVGSAGGGKVSSITPEQKAQRQADADRAFLEASYPGGSDGGPTTLWTQARNALGGAVGGVLSVEAIFPRLTTTQVDMGGGVRVPFVGMEFTGETNLRDSWYRLTGTDEDALATKICESVCGFGTGLGIRGVRRTLGFALARTAEKETAHLAANAGRMFTSADVHVAGAANAIDNAFPGRVVGVNGMRSMSNGLPREVDIDLGNLLVQVKSGKARGLTGQVGSTQASTGVPTIGYAPGISDAAWRNAASQGIPILRSQNELLAYIKEFG